MELVDYAFSAPSVASLVAAGKHGAGRYIGPGSASKHLTAAERDRLLAAGLCIWLSVEGFGNDALQGASLGASHGAMAVRDANWLAVPKDSGLYGNVDFDVTAAQWPACRNYLNAFAVPVRAAGYRAGLYGGLNAIEWGFRDSVADLYWQTYAWSTREVPPGSGNRVVVWSKHAQLQQYHNGVSWPGGGDVDLCRNVADDFGQWPAHTPTTEVTMTTAALVKDKAGKHYWTDMVTNVRPVDDAPRAEVNDFYRFMGRAGAQYAAEVRCKNFNGSHEPYGEPLDAPTYEDLIAMGLVDVSLTAAGGLVPHTHDVPSTGPAQSA
ncbi:MAG: glycoside hydrolase domain-containing protein [Chloroflexota bacterium]